MNHKSTFLTAASLIALSAATLGAEAHAENKQGMEKCYGVVKAGKNDCGNAQGTHSCAGQAQVDGDAGEWLNLPKGTCEHIVGGKLSYEAM